MGRIWQTAVVLEAQEEGEVLTKSSLVGWMMNIQHLTAIKSCTTPKCCGEALNMLDVVQRDGVTCHVQVCRYQKPGNCGVNKYNYLQKMMADYSSCKGIPVNS